MYIRARRRELFTTHACRVLINTCDSRCLHILLNSTEGKFLSIRKQSPVGNMMSLEVLFGAHIKVKQNINLFIKITYLLSKLKPFTW